MIRRLNRPGFPTRLIDLGPGDATGKRPYPRYNHGGGALVAQSDQPNVVLRMFGKGGSTIHQIAYRERMKA